MDSRFFYDPYARRRREARILRQKRLEQVASPDLPVDGDPAETRRPANAIDGLLDAAIESVEREIYHDETAFLDSLAERWDEMFPGCPARPARWRDGILVLHVGNAGQSFAMRPRLPAMKRKILALENAPKERFRIIVQIHAPADGGRRMAAGGRDGRR